MILEQSGQAGIELTAVVLALTAEAPRVLVVRRGNAGAQLVGDALPSGPLDPTRHRTLELGMRDWLGQQTGLDLRYIEQLYTFGNRFRDPGEMASGARQISVAYLALTSETPLEGGQAVWHDWYGFLPWEDWRDGAPRLYRQVIAPALEGWVDAVPRGAKRQAREARVDILFSEKSGGRPDRMRTLERYELLYEMGLLPEAHRDAALLHMAGLAAPQMPPQSHIAAEALGPPMARDSRRMLAAALGRIRGKLAYRPVVFELMEEAFTLLQLQRVVEALTGARLHKQNFRRMLMAGDLVEQTGQTATAGRGRPAALYRFRRDVVRERAMVGVGLPGIQSAN